MTALPLDPVPDLPEPYAARIPTADDVAAVADLVAEQRRRSRSAGAAGVDVDAIENELIGTGSWTRRQIVVEDATGRLVGWAWVHDRAAGRTVVGVIAPDDAVIAPKMLQWCSAAAEVIAAERGLGETQLDTLLDRDDERAHAWFTEAGYRRTRTWLNMKRPVAAGEEFPGPRGGVRIRRVGTHTLDDGTTLPVAEDVQAVHRMLEESFEDHFNSYRESFAEFAQRLREDPGHRWDHWWLALVGEPGSDPATWLPGGALVGSVLSPDDTGVPGSYIDYIGVHRTARGRGVAKALLHTVLADAAERGRNRVGLEVDADSPTGADGLYASMGWETSYVTESWQRDLLVAGT